MNLHRLKKVVILIFAIILVKLVSPQLAFAQQVKPVFQDVTGHWAFKTITAWTEKGLINGYADNTFKPDQGISRAEFISLVNRVFGYTQKTSMNFSDVSLNDWFAEEIAKAKAVGYLAGYPDGTLRPNKQISRQEAAAMLAKILKFKASQDFNNLGSFSDGPLKPITRAEAITLLDRAAGLVLKDPGEFGPSEGSQTIKGNLTINASGITLRNAIITGNLYLTEGIGTGHVILDGVIVQGKTIVSGGGPNSIIVINSELGLVVINVPDNAQVRLVASGTTTVAIAEVQSPAILETANLTGSGFEEVVIAVSRGAGVELRGDFQLVKVETPDAQVLVTSGTITEMLISPQALNSNITLAAGSAVNSLNVLSAATVAGQGMIGTLYAGAPVVMEPWPTTVIIDTGAITYVGGYSASSDNSASAPVSTDNSSGGDSGAGDDSKEEPVVVQPTIPVAVTGVTLDQKEITLTVGEEPITLNATLYPLEAENKNVYWSSSNDDVATVANGIVTPLAPGSAIITVTTEEGNFTDSCEVTVTYNSEEEPVELPSTPITAVTGVTLDPKELTLTAGGEPVTLIATLTPLEAENKNISWSSSNEDVVIVANGIVTPLAPGTAIITVTTEEGNFTDSCEVTVNPPPVKVVYTELENKDQYLAISTKYSNLANAAEDEYVDNQVFFSEKVYFELTFKFPHRTAWQSPIRYTVEANTPVSLAEYLGKVAKVATSYEKLREVKDRDYRIEFITVNESPRNQYNGTVGVTIRAVAGDLYTDYHGAREVAKASFTKTF